MCFSEGNGLSPYGQIHMIQGQLDINPIQPQQGPGIFPVPPRRGFVHGAVASLAPGKVDAAASPPFSGTGEVGHGLHQMDFIGKIVSRSTGPRDAKNGLEVLVGTFVTVKGLEIIVPKQRPDRPEAAVKPESLFTVPRNGRRRRRPEKQEAQDRKWRDKTLSLHSPSGKVFHVIRSRAHRDLSPPGPGIRSGCLQAGQC